VPGGRVGAVAKTRGTQSVEASSVLLLRSKTLPHASSS
jgi:hypothetical protein